MALTPVLELLHITQMVSGFFRLIGFKTGALYVDVLIDSKHLFSNGVQINGFPLQVHSDKGNV